MTTQEVLEGFLISLTRSRGSKSEHQGFALLQSDATSPIVVEMENDNPFEHETLQPLASTRVRITGSWYKDRFIGTKIEKIG